MRGKLVLMSFCNLILVNTQSCFKSKIIRFFLSEVILNFLIMRINIFKCTSPVSHQVMMDSLHKGKVIHAA